MSELIGMSEMPISPCDFYQDDCEKCNDYACPNKQDYRDKLDYDHD